MFILTEKYDENRCWHPEGFIGMQVPIWRTRVKKTIWCCDEFKKDKGYIIRTFPDVGVQKVRHLDFRETMDAVGYEMGHMEKPKGYKSPESVEKCPYCHEKVVIMNYEKYLESRGTYRKYPKKEQRMGVCEFNDNCISIIVGEITKNEQVKEVCAYHLKKEFENGIIDIIAFEKE